MRNRLQVVLPLVQVIVAVALMTSNFMGPDSFANPAWRHADWQILGGLNAPATLVAKYPLEITYKWFSPYYPLNTIVEVIVRLSLIWLLWYFVAIELGGNGQSILAPKTRMRRAVDLVALIFGVVLGCVAILVGRQFAGPPYATLVSVPYLVWGLVLIGFYGHDFWASFARRRRLEAWVRIGGGTP